MRKTALVLIGILILTLGCAGQEVRKEGELAITKITFPPEFKNTETFEIFIFYEGNKGGGNLIFNSIFSYRFPRVGWRDYPQPTATFKNQPEKGTIKVLWRQRVPHQDVQEMDVAIKIWLENASGRSNTVEVFSKIKL